MHYVYVIESIASRKRYIGCTTDLRKRLDKHDANGNTSTAHGGPWQVIYYEAYLLSADAFGREHFLKSGSGWRFLKRQMRHYLAQRIGRHNTYH